jgi:MerR family transcriptional regulator, light-induced transcriptional regulator
MIFPVRLASSAPWRLNHLFTNRLPFTVRLPKSCSKPGTIVTKPVHLMSIGALSKATGIPADTLRTWERRYGFPGAERTDSGHRRYALHTLERLKLVSAALALGHRPSTVLNADEAILRDWIAAAGSATPTPRAARGDAGAPEQLGAIERWLEHVARFEGRAFDREMRAALADHGAMRFLEQLAGPFLHELGARWANGSLGVRHEHFASERLRELLVRQWRPLSDASTGPVLVLATLPGEQHVLGLHMAALALAQHNARLVFLGADAPPGEIARALAHHSAEAVVLSAAAGADRAQLERDVIALRAELGPELPIVAGGAGFQPPLPTVVTVQRLSELVAWLIAAGR